MQGNKFKELLLKKQSEGKVLDPKIAKHKMSIIEELMDAMGEDMGERIKGLKKVTVAASSKEGLEEGLDKAKEVVEEAPMEEEESEESEEESEDVSELKAKISELKSKLSK